LDVDDGSFPEMLLSRVQSARRVVVNGRVNSALCRGAMASECSIALLCNQCEKL